MGLYDDRLLELSEPRRVRRVAQRRASAPRNPMLRPRGERPGVVESKPSMSAQSLLFDRSAGWNVSKAKAWAKSHGYLYGSVDVTDKYVRIRQFDPKGFKVKRTIPFGRGIRAVVAREESSMRTSTARKAPRRAAKKRSVKKSARRAAPKRARRRVKKVTAVAARRRKRTVRVEAKRSRRRRAPRAVHVMEAPKRRRVKRRTSHAEAWKGDSAGHRKAAKKGHRRAKARKHPRRKSRKAREVTYAAAPKRRRSKKRRSTREPMVMEAKRSKRRYHARASSKRSSGMSPGELALMLGMGGLGFVFSDGLDRLLATYDPSAAGDKPKDKFTSDGTGSLANTLNIAARPSLGRIAAGIGLTAAPAVGAYFVDNKYARGALEGLAVGAGINLFKTLWSNLLMPMLVGKDTTTPTLQKSYIARLYPAEVAAYINLQAQKGADGKMAPGPYPAAGVLSDGPADVGPFALAGDSPYPDAAAALRHQAGVQGDSPYPTAADALRAAAGRLSGDSPYPTTEQALRKAAGVGYEPGPPPGVGPGPQAAPHTDPSCGCVGDPTAMFTAFLGDSEESMQ
jgi:hypothetical protein